jgi:hypothetical protein
MMKLRTAVYHYRKLFSVRRLARTENNKNPLVPGATLALTGFTVPKRIFETTPAGRCAWPATMHAYGTVALRNALIT